MTTFRNRRGGYTLLEVLLALGLVAVLLGVAIPLVAESFGPGEAERATSALEATAKAARASALESADTRRVALGADGLFPVNAGLPAARLPKGWTLQVRRLTESKFRKPGKGEVWEFNSEGICEPLSLRVVKGSESAEVTFDPLTALVARDE